MEPVNTIQASEMLISFLQVFSPHLLLVFSMMIAFSIGKFTKDIMTK